MLFLYSSVHKKNKKVNSLQRASRKGAGADAHLKGRLGCSCGLVCCVLRRFDGVEDVLVGSGRIHGTAHQFICTGIPLDPGRQTREVLQQLSSACSWCSDSFGKWRPELGVLQLCSKGATGKQCLLQMCFGPGPWAPLPCSGDPGRPGEASIPGPSSICIRLQGRTHPSSCFASSCKDLACFSASSTSDALLADLESSLTLSLSSCLASFKVAAIFLYSYFFQVNRESVNLSKEHIWHFLELCHNWHVQGDKKKLFSKPIYYIN